MEKVETCVRLLVPLVLVVSIVTSQSLTGQTCNMDRSQASIQSGADAILGGVLSMHNEGVGGYGCGKVTDEMQSYEAIRWVLELLNKKDQVLNGDFLTDTYVPGIKLGMTVRDYCNAREGAVYGSEELFPQFGSDRRACSQTSGLTLGIIGTSDSDSTKDVANFAQPLNIPVISFMATAPELSEAAKFPSFMRTIPPDGPLMDVIVEVIEKLQWKYISIVYTENSHGRQSFEEFHPRLVRAGICLTSAIATSPTDTSNTAINDVLDRLLLAQTVGVLFFGTSPVAYSLLEQSNSKPGMGKLQWIFTDSISLNKQFKNNLYPRGIISIIPTSRYIVEFEDHWIRINETHPSKENPWFQEWYGEQNKCSFVPSNVLTEGYENVPCIIQDESTKRSNFIQDRFVEPAVHAVYSYAVALRNAQRDLCGGPQAKTACAQLRSMSSKVFLNNYLMKVNFTYGKQERCPSLASKKYAPYFSAATVKYDSNGDIVNPVYDIWNLNDKHVGGDTPGFKFRRVGTWIDGTLSVTLGNVRMYNNQRTAALSPLPRSPCPDAGCRPCLGLNPPVKYLYIPGDFIINGIFSIHNPGDMLSCGSFNLGARSGIQYLEAMAYALKSSSSSKILNGVTLGGLGIDDCMSTTMGRNFISEVQRGTLVIKDSSGNVLDPRTIGAYTAADTSALTIPIAQVMNDLKRPVLGYHSLSPVLSDRRRFPYYLRVHPGIGEEMKAIIAVMKKNGWHYVQTVHLQGSSLVDASNDVFRKLAAENGICVVADYKFDDDIIAKLRTRTSVKPVLLIGSADMHRSFLKLVANKTASGEFIIMALSTFGNDMKIVQGYENAADGVISLRWKYPDMSRFYSYLTALRVSNNKQNPWFVEWFEELHNCYLSPTGRSKRPTPCLDRNLNVTGSAKFQLMEESLHVINAIYAVANGLHKTLQEYCGQGYSGLCGNFISSGTRGTRLLENIRASRFTIDGSTSEFRFVGYEGLVVFDIFNYRKGPGFIDVGDYSAETSVYTSGPGTLELYGGAPPTSHSPSCPAFCPQCLYVFQAMKYQYIPGDIVIPAIFDVHRGGMTQFTCGKMRVTNGFQYTEAFAFALEEINKSGALGGLRLGGLLLDGCSSTSRATAMLNNLHKGALHLQDDKMNSIRTQDFLSWMTYNSRSTVKVADILGQIGMPVVSPAATAPLLDDKTRFSTFFRTIKSDTHVARAMAKLTKELGFNYVITLNAPDFSSRETRDVFRQLSQDDGVCTLASYEFETDGTMDNILRLINASTTQVVVVFSEPDVYIPQLLRAKQRFPIRTIFIANRKWNVEPNMRTVVLDSITFNFDSPIVPSFTQYLAGKMPTASNPNPWFREYYEQRYQCNLPGSYTFDKDCQQFIGGNNDVTRNGFIQDLHVLSTINAVYSIAEGVKRTLLEKCNNKTVLCSNFRNSKDTYLRIMAHMDGMSFSDILNDVFKFVAREADRKYNIGRFISDGTQVMVGEYTSSDIKMVAIDKLRQTYTRIKSNCDSQCLVCRPATTNFGDFTYRPGNFFFVGLFDVHRKGATPFTCGDINTKHGYELLEAFNYAIDYVNAKKGIFSRKLNGVDIGAIGLDICQSPTRAGNLVANIHSGNINLKKGDIQVHPESLDLYIGTLETKSSIRVADVLSVLSIPQISYGATSLELRNADKYKYFLRTVPADDKQARAIISYLKRFNLTEVQIISTFDSVGQKGKEEFLRLAHLNRICVDQKITIGKTGPVLRPEATQTLDKVITNKHARVVVLFVDDPRPILQAAEDHRIFKQEKYFFIGTDKWGMDLDMLDRLDVLIKDRRAVTLDIETADLPGFDRYLEGRVPNTTTRNPELVNPWFEEFFQEVHNCYVNNPSLDVTRQCGPADLGIPRAPGYVQDPYVLYVVNAVFSAALGLHYAIEEVCGKDYSYACNLFRTSGEKRQRIYRNIKDKASFIDATQQPFFYTPDGESDRGYHIYQPQPNIGRPGFGYKNIGSYNDTHYLKMDIRYEINEQSYCLGECLYCNFAKYQPSRYMLKSNKNDLNLVYIGNIHSHDPRDMFNCGAINTDIQFQNMMAFFYAIESVNNNTNRRFPASLKFGGLALDACNSPYRLGEDIYSLMSGEGLCGTNERGQIIQPSTIVTVITASTSISLPVSSMLSPLKITTMSPSATSVELSDKQFHPYFLRTVPPDNIQAIVMLEIMKEMNWDYATVVYSVIPYGIAAKNTLLQQANRAKSIACIADIQGMQQDAKLFDAERIIDDLSQQVGSKVIILFTIPEHSRLLLQATRSKGMTGRFVWLASDYWANSQYIVRGYEAEASGAITIQIRSELVTAFTRYLTSLSLTNRRGIPDDWFEDIYQNMHKCRLLSAGKQEAFSSICTGQERITDSMIPQDPFVLHTIISVFITAQGLNGLQECRNLPQLEISACLALQKTQRRDIIYNGILNAQWNVLPADLNDTFTFSFTDKGYGDVGYNIFNYHRDSTVEHYVYTKIGSYQGGLTLDRRRYSGGGILQSGVLPISQCPAGITCACLNPDGATTHNYIRQSTSVSAYSNAIYILGKDNNYYNTRTGQLVEVNNVPSVTSRFTDIWAIMVATLAAIGCFISICMFVYLLVVYPNRGGTSILGYTLCFGIILCYALVFAFIAHANAEICALRRFALGFVYALCYGALFVKLIDSWRNQDKLELDMVKYRKLGKPCGFFMVVMLLVVVQVIICAEWLILEPPDTQRVLYNNQLWPRCAPDDFYDEGLVLSLVYVMLLIFLSVVFGFATFQKSKTHYESRWILGIAVLSIPCWVIWCLVATIGVYKVRDAAVAIGLLVNATFMLLLGPLRKLYLLNKYQVMIEEEEEEEKARFPDYASTYGRQYDNVGRMQADSVRGSHHGGAYPSRGYANSAGGTQRSTGSAYNPYAQPTVQREETQIL